MKRLLFAIVLFALGMEGTVVAGDAERAFLVANQAAMDRMMAGMDAKPTGDVDADFVNMMEPHHRGAIDMAVLELRYGHNPRLRRIAQEIIVGQGQEIDAMRLSLGRRPQQSAPVPTQITQEPRP